jgi:hypothetical protein
VISPSQGLYLYTGQHKHRHRKTHKHINIHASSRIRTYDHGIRASYRDPQFVTITKVVLYIKPIYSVIMLLITTYSVLMLLITGGSNKYLCSVEISVPISVKNKLPQSVATLLNEIIYVYDWINGETMCEH